MGHEFAGRIVETGPGADAFQLGQAVAINPHLYCYKCHYCVIGRPVLCDNRPILGCHKDGGWAEYVAVPQKNCYPLPKGADPYLGALIEPLSVAVHACERVPVHVGDTVLIMGAGAAGLMHLLMAREAGAGQIAMAGLGVDKERLALARRYGAVTVNIEKEDLTGFVRKLNPRGADVAFETSGSPAALQPMVYALGKGGRGCLVGFCATSPEIDSFDMVIKEKELVGSRAYNKSTWELSTALFGKLLSELSQMVTHDLPFSEINHALDLITERACIKTIIHP